MIIFEIWTKDKTKLIAMFRNAIDRDWFLQTTNEESPLVSSQSHIDEESDEFELWRIDKE